MSTLSTANIQTKAANTPPVIKDVNGTECGQFVRAWVTYDGVNNTVLASFNVSSVTDNTTGDYTINFTNALSNVNFCVGGSTANTTNNFTSLNAGATRGPVGIQMAGDVAPTTSSVTVETLYGATAAVNGAKVDHSRCNVIVYGD